MGFPGASIVSFNGARARASTRIAALAAVAVGLATLAAGGVAADEPDAEAKSAAAADTGSRQADRRGDAQAEDGAADAAGKVESASEADEVRRIESEVIVREPVPVERCRKVRSTGSRVPKEVCTTITPTLSEGDRAAATAQEERTRDYLRRRDQHSNRAPSDNGIIGGDSALGGVGGGL